MSVKEKYFTFYNYLSIFIIAMLSYSNICLYAQVDLPAPNEIDMQPSLYIDSGFDAQANQLIGYTNTDSLRNKKHVIPLIKNFINGIKLKYADKVNNADSVPNLEKGAVLKNTYVNSVSLGTHFSYSPVFDTTLIAPKIYKAYWFTGSAQVYNLPINFSINSNENMMLNGPESAFTTQTNFQFNYQQYIANVKSDFLQKVAAESVQLQAQLTAFDFIDTTAFYEFIKDTLANQQYQLLVNKLKVQQQELTDSVSNCYEVDTLLLDSIKMVLAQYDSYRNQFNQMISLQNDYYALLSQYEATLSKIQTFSENVASLNDFTSISNVAELAGYQTALPQWPSRFKTIGLGVQYVDHTPLTLQHYTSNGLALHYEHQNTILIANALTQNNLPQFNVISEADTLFNPYQTKQKAGLVAYGIGSLDSNFILFTASALQEQLPVSETNIKALNGLFSIYQWQSIADNFFGSYEVVLTSFIGEKFDNITDSSINDNLFSKVGAFASIGYKSNKAKFQLDLEFNYLGLAYINLSNPFLLPGTTNTSVVLLKQLLKNKINISYKLTFTTPLSVNPNQSEYISHLGQFIYSGSKGLGIMFTIAPFQYTYQIQDFAENESMTFGTMLNGTLYLHKKLLNFPISTYITYSNFSTQNSLTDTIMVLNVSNFNFNSIVTFSGKSLTMQGLYYVPNEITESALFNYYSATYEFISNPKVQFACGPKYIDYHSYNDQMATTISGSFLLLKNLYWQFNIDKCFDLNQGYQDAYADLFFNTTIGLTLNVKK